MTGDEAEKFWRNVQCTVEKDAVRTDRSHPYFKGEDNPNIEVLKYVQYNNYWVILSLTDFLTFNTDYNCT